MSVVKIKSNMSSPSFTQHDQCQSSSSTMSLAKDSTLSNKLIQKVKKLQSSSHQTTNTNETTNNILGIDFFDSDFNYAVDLHTEIERMLTDASPVLRNEQNKSDIITTQQNLKNIKEKSIINTQNSLLREKALLIYSTFLSDTIKQCKQRALECESPHDEYIMHLVLSQYLSETCLAPNKIEIIINKMVKASRDEQMRNNRKTS